MGWIEHGDGDYIAQKNQRIFALETENAELKEEIAKGLGRRRHTHEWYERHYGKLHDWARTVLPEEYRHQFFSCIANGLYDGMKDVGKPYRTVAGFMVTPGGYFKMDTAQEQILFDQCVRAEDAEAERDALKVKVAILSKAVTFENGTHGVTNLRGPLVLKHGPDCAECEKVAANVRAVQKSTGSRQLSRHRIKIACRDTHYIPGAV